MNTDPEITDLNGAYRRLDENEDRLFYATDRFVNHLDAVALETVESLVGQLITEEHPDVLDLMASWDSHIPPHVRPARVVGLGLNENELARNRSLTEHVLHDLNREPNLPFGDHVFDAVLCTVSVDYLTRPVEVFREVGRVLEPGGLLLVTFSNRYFPSKVVAVWRDATDLERLQLVRGYFRESGLFEESDVVVSKGRERPLDDIHARPGLASDPIYAVYAPRVGGHGRPRPRPVLPGTTPAPEPEELRRRKNDVAANLRCPHCGRPLQRWRVPQTPFTQWSSDHQFICFDDRCPHYVGGWTAFAKQGNPGSYRFMYDPDSGGCHSVPVLTPTSLRDSIVPFDGETEQTD